DVVEADLVAEGDGGGVAAVLAADAELEAGLGTAPPLDREADELADALLVERLERVVREDPGLDVAGEELARVVAAVAEGHLREVVRPEREEVGLLGDGGGGQRRARHL